MRKFVSAFPYASPYVLVGPGGEIPVCKGDEVTRKFLMLVEGEFGEVGPFVVTYSNAQNLEILRPYYENLTEKLE